jgi:beta-N-acetylhexosaminidase
MSHARTAARTLIVGVPATAVETHAVRVVKALGVAGVILFRRNVQTPEQTHGLIAALRGLRDEPLLLAVDQEGGRVQRLRSPLTEFPPMRALGDTNDLALAREVGAQLAREMLAVGFDLDFAPVVDVDTNPNNPVIGDRSFGRTPEVVSTLAVALIEGMQRAGMMACAKHFPGHGDTLEDSHKDVPSLPHTLERLRQIEWPPFAAAARADVSSIMTAHVMFPALDPKWPATMSKTCLSVLRNELGYQGVIISDDLEMNAIADRYDIGAAAVQSIAAGCDSLLVCHTLSRIEASVEALAKEADKSGAFRARLEEAAARVDAMRAKVGAHSASYVAPAAPAGKLAEWLASRKQHAKLVDPTEALVRPS